VTKKEIVKQIADAIGETQLRTKDIVQRTFKAIVDTLMEQGRIELRNFGVFEVKQRKARKARNPRTGEKVEVPPKCVVTFKPGKDMEEQVRRLTHVPVLTDGEADADTRRRSNGAAGAGHDGGPRSPRSTRTARSRKPVPQPLAEVE